MASTTFKQVRTDVAALIVGITPTERASIVFREIEDRNALEDLPRDKSTLRKFEVDSGGLREFSSVFATDLVRDSQKDMIVRVAYPVLDNNRLIRDMADEDENIIIRTLEHPANRPTGVLQILLDATTHDVQDGLRFVEYTFMVHYNHE